MKKVCIVNCFDTYEQRVDLLHDYFIKHGFETVVYTSDYRHLRVIGQNELIVNIILCKTFKQWHHIMTNTLIRAKISMYKNDVVCIYLRSRKVLILEGKCGGLC